MLRKIPIRFWLSVLLLTPLTLSCQFRPQPENSSSPTPTSTPAAQSQPPGFPQTVIGKEYPGKGIVKEINLKEKWLTIDHEEIKDLMPAMIMEFWVRDPSLLTRIRVGDKVDFVVVEDNKGQYLKDLMRAPR